MLIHGHLRFKFQTEKYIYFVIYMNIQSTVMPVRAQFRLMWTRLLWKWIIIIVWESTYIEQNAFETAKTISMGVHLISCDIIITFWGATNITKCGSKCWLGKSDFQTQNVLYSFDEMCGFMEKSIRKRGRNENDSSSIGNTLICA